MWTKTLFDTLLVDKARMQGNLKLYYGKLNFLNLCERNREQTMAIKEVKILPEHLGCRLSSHAFSVEFELHLYTSSKRCPLASLRWNAHLAG